MAARLTLPSTLLLKDERRQRLWGAVHALIVQALKEEEEEEEPNNKAKENQAEEDEEEEEEEGQVREEVTTSASGVEEEGAKPHEQMEEEREVAVVFWPSHVEDPSGLWNELLMRNGEQQSQLEYDVQSGSIVGMSEEEAGVLRQQEEAENGSCCPRCGALPPSPPPAQRRSTQQQQRYHDPERFAQYAGKFRVGQLSDTLMRALGVQQDPFAALRQRLGVLGGEEEDDEGEEGEEEDEYKPCEHDVGDMWSRRALPPCGCCAKKQDGECPRKDGRFVYVSPAARQLQRADSEADNAIQPLAKRARPLVESVLEEEEIRPIHRWQQPAPPPPPQFQSPFPMYSSPPPPPSYPMPPPLPPAQQVRRYV